MADDDSVLRDAITTVVSIGAEMNRRNLSIAERVAAMSRLAESATAGQRGAGDQADVHGQLGRDLDDAADGLEVDVDALERAVASIDEAMTVVLRAADALGRPDQPARAEANEVLTSFVLFADQAASGAAAFRVFEQVLAQAEEAPEPLGGACRRLRALLRRVSACYAQVDEWGSAAAELLIPPDATTL